MLLITYDCVPVHAYANSIDECPIVANKQKEKYRADNDTVKRGTKIWTLLIKCLHDFTLLSQYSLTIFFNGPSALHFFSISNSISIVMATLLTPNYSTFAFEIYFVWLLSWWKKNHFKLSISWNNRFSGAKYIHILIHF